jgi:cytochrome oxidase Cu insertion factor (SCO1/SenC/PrrC family)
MAQRLGGLLMRKLVFLVVLGCLSAVGFAPGNMLAQGDKDKSSRAAAKPQDLPPLKLKVGDPAPDFTLKDQNGKEISLHDFRGKKSVALAFYIFAFTGG